jgi:hypothetical protein
MTQEQSSVGIFWLIGDRLILDTSQLSEAEPYGDCLGHRTSHLDYWTAQQCLGTVSREIEYEAPPRGRVSYNRRSKRFDLYADRCILKRKAVVKRIMEAMHLPASRTNIGTDGHSGHYKCSKCLETFFAREDDF